MYFLIITFLLAWVAFIAFAADKRREHFGMPPVAEWLLAALAVIAPIGAAGAMALFGMRPKRNYLFIMVPVALCLYCLLTYLLRQYLL